jgi:translation initiation factor IF-3
MPLVQALDLAKKHNFDLVEVAPTSVPPVCRLLDYGKYRFEQAKKEREARKSQKISLLREIRLRPKIGEHDIEAKLRIVKKLLDGGDKVKVGVLFRGREITHPEIARRLLQRVVETTKDVASVEGPPLVDGRRMDVVLAPLVIQKAKKVDLKKDEEVSNAKDKNS